MNDESEISDVSRHPVELRARVTQFALRIIRLYGRLPKSTVSEVIGKQVLRSGTSVGAHYHEAQRARSSAEFISKMEVGIQELSETGYWLTLLVESGTVAAELLSELRQECNELTSIFV